MYHLFVYLCIFLYACMILIYSFIFYDYYFNYYNIVVLLFSYMIVVLNDDKQFLLFIAIGLPSTFCKKSRGAWKVPN